MKTALFTATLLVVVAASLYGQNINNTLGSSGTFTIKDGSTTFLSLSQSTGILDLNRNLTLLSTTDSTLGVIYKGAGRFIHDYQAPGTYGFNTFIGLNSGNFTMSGAFQQASYNTAVGSSSLYTLTNGAFNSAFGVSSLLLNTSGSDNSGFGYNSLHGNTTGFGNSGFGRSALVNNSTGTDNSGFGLSALRGNTTGNNNSALGDSAGFNLTTGSNNTIIGASAQFASATADNQVQIGNSAVTYAGVQVAWTITSDRRWKSNITGSYLGLAFVSKLRPVSYTRKNDAKNRSEYGFIAQDIEEVLKEAGVKNAGMLTVDDQGMYELRYNDLLAPMVKAIQELKAENDALKNQFVMLRSTIADEVQKEVKAVLLKADHQEDVKTSVSFNGSKN
jgi:trimeric autotransporter adhesin